MAYAWAAEPNGEVVCRFFFIDRGAVIEDPATGSACANLGAFLLARGRRGPFRLELRQGDAVERPSRLTLAVDEAGAIFVSGRVIQIARGTLSL
jgi:predicted PhzF superfamily epimerase YddE/YHI9